jgi:hypothetical protein
VKAAGGVVIVFALACCMLSGQAAAEVYDKFANCPFTNPKALKCIYSVTEGGEVILGKRRVPILNPVTVQGGYTTPAKDHFSEFIPPTRGPALSSAAQPIPGGLLGVASPAESSPLVKVVTALAFENALTGVSATLELAKPASEIRISETHLAEELGVALRLPLKIHLENPLLGPDCYLGSSSTPIVWELTSGKTNPPPPNSPIAGGGGKGEFLDEGRIFALEGFKLADNAWRALAARGCGGPFSSLVDPAIDKALGLPIAAGRNTALLLSTINLAAAAIVDEEIG